MSSLILLCEKYNIIFEIHSTNKSRDLFTIAITNSRKICNRELKNFACEDWYLNNFPKPFL